MWSIFWNWVTYTGPTVRREEKHKSDKERKHKNIPILSDYSKPPPKYFWTDFPKREIPTRISTKLDVRAPTGILEDRKTLLNKAEYERGKKIVNFLTNGAPSYQKSKLPPVFCKNARSTLDHGAQLTDTVADWVEKGFVAGPFDSPPLEQFRVNPLMVKEEKSKVRLVLNVSSPPGRSFNENIDQASMERVYMSSAQKFSYSVIKAGKGGIMTKFDMKDAYKNVPCNIEDLRLQEWCGKYFAELSQIFGAKSAVPNYDMLGNTVSALARAVSRIPKSLVHRQLDDVPTVAPAFTDWCQQFTENYKEVCEKVGIQLAEECSQKDKAFCNSTHGKVLGINFDTKDLTWNLPEDKSIEYGNLSRARTVLSGRPCSVCSALPPV